MRTSILVVALVGAAVAHAEIHSPYSSGSLLIDTHAEPPPVIYTPKDPIREFDGLVYTLRGVDQKNGWVQFQGKIVEVQSEGLRIVGSYTGNSGQDGEGAEFMLKHFPYPMAMGETISILPDERHFFIAHTAGTFTYNAVSGGSRTLRLLDYGQIHVPTPEEIEAAKKIADAKKEADQARAEAGAERALKHDMELADKGDAYGLYRMGERYRDGQGVEKDLAKAKDYLTKAVAAGEPSAQAELDALPKQ